MSLFRDLEVAVRHALFARFPRLRSSAVSAPVIPPERRAAHPELAPDFAVLDREVAPAFARYDAIALRDQNRYRRQQMLVLLGSALITGLGGLQAVLSGERWPAILLAVVGVALATSARYAGESETLRSYLEARGKAERLRALHFRYLSMTGPYAGRDRDIALRRAVHAIHADKEPE
ncbi:DUF4231 domain-containing protein [Nonomuraea rhodomycinica]|uniref:DUF4231 domain-containing protein n=1 Tax=Nonomuraea rhodomycinica TaxID=1712872 RepID=A0A7Y6MEC3_9ACTN|nr:DUF4231 domain-containing protein [Nonomuraea rhodomycinica]NUW43850.1 DUF4231 domain-containing protein [Nonomuraea rhodomycinica]